MFGSTFSSHVCVLPLFFFFFFFHSRVLVKRGYCSCTIQWTVTANVDFSTVNSDYVLFIDPQIPLFSNFFIKNGSHGTIYTFKNYFATVISAISFQFQQNKSYPNRPYICSPNLRGKQLGVMLPSLSQFWLRQNQLWCSCLSHHNVVHLL